MGYDLLEARTKRSLYKLTPYNKNNNTKKRCYQNMRTEKMKIPVNLTKVD